MTVGTDNAGTGISSSFLQPVEIKNDTISRYPSIFSDRFFIGSYICEVSIECVNAQFIV
jgi:hypothetical protein